MGNIGSQSGHINERILPEPEPWSNSFPRQQQQTKLKPQIKVLPEGAAHHRKLRTTNNGEILHSGGTLTGRQRLANELRAEYASRNRLAKEIDSPHKSRIQGVQQRIQNASHKSFQEQMRSSRSEPDLRYSLTDRELKQKRSKKKYKAPPPPQNFRVIRAEPDGAFSSYTASPLPASKFEDLFKVPDQIESRQVDSKMCPPATKELSEFRQPQREYKDYRGKYTSDSSSQKHTTIHPQVTCNMPKVNDNKNKEGNYRKDFVYGMKSSISCGSTYSEESQNISQVYHSKYGSITRF